MIGLLFGFGGRIGRGLFWLVQVPLIGIVRVYADHRQTLPRSRQVGLLVPAAAHSGDRLGLGVD
jgi:uncharacterized membrane protein YhaH (DUF805 family)